MKSKKTALTIKLVTFLLILLKPASDKACELYSGADEAISVISMSATEHYALMSAIMARHTYSIGRLFNLSLLQAWQQMSINITPVFTSSVWWVTGYAIKSMLLTDNNLRVLHNMPVPIDNPETLSILSIPQQNLLVLGVVRPYGNTRLSHSVTSMHGSQIKLRQITIAVVKMVNRACPVRHSQCTSF